MTDDRTEDEPDHPDHPDHPDGPERPEDPEGGLDVTGEVWHWRGPAPYYFVTVPDGPSRHLRDVAADVTYGWGMIPVRVQTGATVWQTSLWPKDGRYVVPLKDAVRFAEGIEEGDVVTVRLVVSTRR